MNDEPELPLAADAVPVAEACATIDAMSFEDMLRAVRCKPLGDPLFVGELGKYFHAAMKKKRADTPPEERVEASKRIGF